MGRSCSNWSQLKASLLIALRGLGVRWAFLYASAAFLGSLEHSKELVSDILGYTSPTSIHLVPTLKDLLLASDRNDWSSLERVGVPLR